MKLDMHCHTLEGSSDAHVSIVEYAKKLKELGFDGMLVTDHDSYKGYNYYKNEVPESEKPEGFVVLKGIEYDTFDAGHMIIVMPSDVELPILEIKGLPVRILIHIVHEYGGIIGPAHPCGEPFLSIFSTGVYKKMEWSIAKRFDFIEGYNSGEDSEANERAKLIAGKFGKPVTGGSDAHIEEAVGIAYTILKEDIKTEDELIEYIKLCKPSACGGRKNLYTIKEKLGPWNKLLVYGFFPYNKFGAIVNSRHRREELRKIKKDLHVKQTEAEIGIEYLKERSDDFRDYLEDIFDYEEVQRMKDYIQHGSVSTFEHCESVARASDKLARLLRLRNYDRRSLVRGAMMHDFYLYDWHDGSDGTHKRHGYHHANKAVDNAAEILDATMKEQEIIATHMWPLTLTRIPKSKEGWVVCMADKYVSTKETIRRRKRG